MPFSLFIVKLAMHGALVEETIPRGAYVDPDQMRDLEARSQSWSQEISAIYIRSQTKTKWKNIFVDSIWSYYFDIVKVKYKYYIFTQKPASTWINPKMVRLVFIVLFCAGISFYLTLEVIQIYVILRIFFLFFFHATSITHPHHQ